jgi:hypothetical protein
VAYSAIQSTLPRGLSAYSPDCISISSWVYCLFVLWSLDKPKGLVFSLIAELFAKHDTVNVSVAGEFVEGVSV